MKELIEKLINEYQEEWDYEDMKENNAGIKELLKKRIAKVKKMKGEQFDKLTSKDSYTLEQVRKKSIRLPGGRKWYTLSVRVPGGGITGLADGAGDDGKKILEDHIKDCVRLAK